MEKKEAEVEQLRVGNTGSMTASQKAKVFRFGISPNLKPETWQRPNDDTKSSEVTGNIILYKLADFCRHSIEIFSNNLIKFLNSQKQLDANDISSVCI